MEVVHCKKEKHDVYIGRPSKWGNPFKNNYSKLLPNTNGKEELVGEYIY